jgi:hypothetical protein
LRALLPSGVARVARAVGNRTADRREMQFPIGGGRGCLREMRLGAASRGLQLRRCRS